MDSLTRHATLIDTLGILLPGGIFLLTIHFFGIWNVAAPWQKLAGDGELGLLLYFMSMSYLCGSLIHQVGRYIENFIQFIWMKAGNLIEKLGANRKRNILSGIQEVLSRLAVVGAVLVIQMCPYLDSKCIVMSSIVVCAVLPFLIPKSNMHAKYWNEHREELLRLCTSRSISFAPKLAKANDTDFDRGSDIAMIDTGKNIFRYVQRNERSQRIVIFSAFHAMCRSMCTLLLLILCSTFVCLVDPDIAGVTVEVVNLRYFVMICIISMYLFFRRWLDYVQYSVNEAYRLFLA